MQAVRYTYVRSKIDFYYLLLSLLFYYLFILFCFLILLFYYYYFILCISDLFFVRCWHRQRKRFYLSRTSPILLRVFITHNRNRPSTATRKIHHKDKNKRNKKQKEERESTVLYMLHTSTNNLKIISKKESKKNPKTKTENKKTKKIKKKTIIKLCKKRTCTTTYVLKHSWTYVVRLQSL